jgi:integrase
MSTGGSIIKRGKNSYRLKFDIGRDPATGRRRIQYHTFRGTKQDAKIKLAELIASVGNNAYTEPSKTTVADLVTARIDQWEGAGDISPRTAQRYRQLLDNQIAPQIGATPIQKLTTVDIETWHSTLRTGGRQRGQGGVSPRTVVHAHRVLSHALEDAARHKLVVRNEAKLQPPPKVEGDEVEILDDAGIDRLVAKLRPGNRESNLSGDPIYVPAVLAVFTGMRLGEILALRWANVDLDGAARISVRETLEETKALGIRFKRPKTRSSRRDIGLPDIVIDTLREHRRAQLEMRLQLGLGKMPDDALVFPTIDGGPQSPSDVSRTWGLVADRLDIPEITFHCLRHTHASQLIDRGVDIVTISKRLGHASPDITLRVYAHLFRNDDSKAAQAINEALTGIGRA